MICYGCTQNIAPGTANCPNCGQPAYTVLTTAKPSAGRRIDGCLPGIPSAKDYRAVPRLAGGLPRQVDLRADCSPIEDQGRIGSCVANAACGALEFQHKKLGQPQVPMSRMFVYFNARRMRNTVDRDSGLIISEGMASLLAYGAPDEARWPYVAENFAAEPAPELYGEAMKNQPAEYARVERGDGVLGAVANGYPVVFGISLPMRCFAEGGASGLIPEATAEEYRTATGGHSMLIVGYDLDKKTYLLRNSWGKDWGEAGYARIPFSVVEAASQPNEFWILGKLDDQRAFTITRPNPLPTEGSVAGKAEKMREAMRGDLEKDMADRTKSIRDRFRQRPPGA